MENHIVSTEELAQQVREMRKQQVSYFSSRSHSALKKSKELEAKVDKLLKDIPEPPKMEQKKLF
jgi:hypothetical protein